MSGTRKALVWSLAERYVSLVIGVVSSMLIARLLTPAEIGIYSLCAASVAIATMVREFGVNDYIIQERTLDEMKLRGAFAVAFTTAWTIGGVIYLGRDALAGAYNEPRIADLLNILSLNFLLLPFSSPVFALLNREVALRQIFVLQTTASVLQAVVGVGLAFAGFGPASLAWSALTGVVVQTVLLTAMRPRSAFMLPSFKAAGAIFRYGAYQMSSRLVDTLTGNAHEFLIAKQLGFTELGLFSRAKGLIDMFHLNLMTAVIRVTTPTMAAIHRADTSLVQSFGHGTAMLTAICWPAYGFLAIAAPEIILVMLGPQWGKAAPVGSLLAVAMAPTSLYALSAGVMVAMGQVERKLRVSLTSSPIHLTSLLIGMPFGLNGMAAMWIVGTGSIGVVHAFHLRKLLAVPLRVLYRPCLASLPVAAASIGAQAAAMGWARHMEVAALLAIAMAFIAGGVVWLAGIFAVRHPIAGELARLISNVAARRRKAVR